MLVLRSFSTSLSLVLSTLAISGCNAPSQKDSTAPSAVNTKASAVEVSKSSIDSVQFTRQGTLKIKGKVDQISKLQIKTDTGFTQLKIIKNENGFLEAAANSALRLSAGKIYGLVVNSANADEMIIPIQLEISTQGPAGPQGAPGPQGVAGPAGANGATGPTGAPGRGASIVIKNNSGQAIAYFMTAVDASSAYDGINSRAMLMLASTGKIIDVDLITGKIAESTYQVYFSGTNCTGTPYLNYRLASSFPTLGRIVRTKGDNRYFEITAFVASTNAASYLDYTTSGSYGTCHNQANTLGNTAQGLFAATLQSVSAPLNLESFAPLQLQLE